MTAPYPHTQLLIDGQWCDAAEDADIAQAVKAPGSAKFRNAGQVCIAPTRFLVHRSILGEFERALVAQTQKLKVGEGVAEDTTMGPLTNPRRLAAMQQITEDAVQRGAKIALGGERIGSSGNYFTPTVLTEVPLDAMLFNQEPFGPMAALRGFDTLDEAIAESKRLPFGLASYAYTRLAGHGACAVAAARGRPVVGQPAGAGRPRDALRRRQGFWLRQRGRPLGARGLPGAQGGVDPDELIPVKPGW